MPEWEYSAEAPGTITAEDLTRAIRARERVTIAHAVIEGDVDLRSLDAIDQMSIRHGVFKGSWDAGEAHFTKSLDLSGCTFQQRVNFAGVHVEGRLVLEGATLRGDKRNDADFRQLHVAGDLEASGLQSDVALDFGSAHVGGDLSLGASEERAMTCGGSLRLSGVRVAGLVDLSGAQIDGDLTLQGANVGDNLLCHPWAGQRTQIHGDAWLARAHLAGQANFSGAWIKKDLNLQGANLGDSLLCTPYEGERTEIGGDAWLARAHIPGHVLLSGAAIGRNLNLRGAEVRGSVFCDPDRARRTEIGADVWLSLARVSGQVVLSGASIAGEVSLQSAEVEGDVLLLPDGKNHTEIQGALDGQGCQVRSLKLEGGLCGDRPVDLALAQVTRLEIKEGLPARLNLEGTQFQHLVVPRDDYLGLLQATTPFRKSTYVAVEKWLRNQGEEHEANRIYVAMRRRNRTEGGMGWPTRVGEWLLLDLTIRYGTASYWLLVYFLPLFALSWWLFSAPESVSPRTTARADRLSEHRTTIDAFWTAAQVHVPMLPMPAADEWKPSDKPILVGGWPVLRYDTYALIISLMSWVAVPIFLAGVSGLVKRQASA